MTVNGGEAVTGDAALRLAVRYVGCGAFYCASVGCRRWRSLLAQEDSYRSRITLLTTQHNAQRQGTTFPSQSLKPHPSPSTRKPHKGQDIYRTSLPEPSLVFLAAVSADQVLLLLSGLVFRSLELGARTRLGTCGRNCSTTARRIDVLRLTCASVCLWRWEEEDMVSSALSSLALRSGR